MIKKDKLPQNEQEMSEILEQYRILSESIVEAIIITDFKGKLIYFNDSALLMMGIMDKDALKSPNVFDFLMPGFRAQAIRDFYRVFQDGGKFLAEYKIKTLDGREIWVETLGQKITYRRTLACFNVIRDITKRKLTQKVLKDKYEELEHRVRARTIELSRSNKALELSIEKLERSLKETIHTLAFAVEKRDPYTAGHQLKVSQLAFTIAKEMGFTKDYVDGVYMTAIVHDIGKIYLPAEILSKPTKLNSIEFSLIRTHAEVGYDILKSIDFPWPLAEIIYQHHERLNGSGYPLGLNGKEILMEARILAVADVVEAMASHRPYRPALGIDQAMDEIKKNRGILYDPEVVDVCRLLFKHDRFHWN